MHKDSFPFCKIISSTHFRILISHFSLALHKFLLTYRIKVFPLFFSFFTEFWITYLTTVNKIIGNWRWRSILLASFKFLLCSVDKFQRNFTFSRFPNLPFTKASEKAASYKVSSFMQDVEKWPNIMLQYEHWKIFKVRLSIF